HGHLTTRPQLRQQTIARRASGTRQKFGIMRPALGKCRMPVPGQSRPKRAVRAMSAISPIAIAADIAACLKRARYGLMHRNKQYRLDLYSITTSARASSVADTERPSVLAVLRLIANSNLVGA